MNNFGYAGKILRVDLSSRKTWETPTSDYANRFLGGRGIASKIYWDEVEPETGAFDENNILIFAVGPLAGIPALGGSRWGAFGKSPFPSPEMFCYGNLGGSWGAELRFAGYDALAVQGISDKPVILRINDSKVEFIDADDMKGKGAIETREVLRSKLGKNVKVAAIGPAGENMVTNAIILADGDSSCSGGLGAVMGSKKLKAVAVNAANRKVKVADSDKLSEIAKYIRSIERGNTKVWGIDFMAHGPKTNIAPCYGCMAHCLRVNYTADDGRKGKFMCQSRFFYFVHSLMFHKEDNDVPFHANKLCDEYGIDTWELQRIMEWLIRCKDAGLVSEEETGIPFSKVGSLEFIESLVKTVSLREGIGSTLSLGLEQAAEKLGDEWVKQLFESNPYEPRLYSTNMLVYPFEPREPIQQVHEVGLTLAQWASWAKGDKNMHISSDVLRDIAKRFWGSEDAADMTTYSGKAMAAKLIQDRQYAKECLVVCDWMYPVIDVPKGNDHVGDPTIESQIYSAVMGKTTDEESLNLYGERVFNLQRAIMLREGHRAKDDDYLPEDWHTRPLEKHVADPDFTAPGKDGEIISRKGAVIEKEPFEKTRAEYYSLRKWDKDTGLQTREQLEGLDMKDIADELEKIKLLA